MSTKIKKGPVKGYFLNEKIDAFIDASIKFKAVDQNYGPLFHISLDMVGTFLVKTDPKGVAGKQDTITVNFSQYPLRINIKTEMSQEELVVKLSENFGDRIKETFRSTEGRNIIEDRLLNLVNNGRRTYIDDDRSLLCSTLGLDKEDIKKRRLMKVGK